MVAGAGVAAGPATGGKRTKDNTPGAVCTGLQGTIIKVKVSNGDAVKVGDVICVIEAMKMEQEIKAPHGGKVKEVFVKAGTAVSVNDVLMQVE